jgi:hypothetical protein
VFPLATVIHGLASVGTHLFATGTFQNANGDGRAGNTEAQALHVAPGRHVFRVKARDRAGHLDTTPAVRRFKVKRANGSHSGSMRIRSCRCD